ncbi:hypothetical protein [Methylobacterium currus]|uniref:hypothetical protein n=1 Tax=Methylobacterium currus TaxID=2051553 RepID=UPI0013DFA8EB|nr:hypothetical protein [Methylobacterium currus]
MAEEQEAGEPREDDRKDRGGFSWWDLPDLIDVVVWIARGIWGLITLIVGTVRD